MRSRMELVAQERATAERLHGAYRQLIAPTRRAIQDAGETVGSVREFDRYVDLQAMQQQMRVALDEMEWMLQAEGETLTRSAANTALGYAEMSAGVVTGWNAPDPRTLRNAVSFMERPAMQEAIRMWAPYHAESLTNVALTGISLGYNPRKTADLMMAYVDNMPLADAERMMRTVQNWSYRTATTESWRENPNVVSGWWWRSSLNERACIGCISMHGSVHTVDEVLNDHHRGVCVQVPIVAGRTLPGEDAGLAWFREQPEARQIGMMGRARWTAWRDDAFEWRQLSRTYRDAVYGEMRTETPLRDLVSHDAALRYQAEARAARARAA